MSSICVAGKPRKSSRSSRRSYESAKIQSLDFHTLPVSHSTDELKAKKELKFSKHIISRPVKGFNLRSLGLKKNPQLGPKCRMPTSRSCEELDGFQGRCISPRHCKRSYSLGDLPWQQSNDQKEEKGSQSVCERKKEAKNAKSLVSPRDVAVDRLESKSEQIQATRETDQVDRSLVPTQLGLKSSCHASDVQPTSLALRSHHKKPPVPPPVPAKKSKDRLSNGLRHPPLVSGSSPGTPAVSPKPLSRHTSPYEGTLSTPTSPDVSEQSPSTAPAWMSDLPESACQQIQGVRVALGRKISHAKVIDLEILLEEKLSLESIDLMTEPYSDKVGDICIYSIVYHIMQSGTDLKYLAFIY